MPSRTVRLRAFPPVDLRHADQLKLGPGGIGERPQQIEDRAKAELLANRRGVFHRPVQQRGEAETDADFVDAAANLLGRQLQVDAERFEDVGRAAFAGDAAIAVLGDVDPEPPPPGRRGTDVERLQAIAAGPAGIEQSGRPAAESASIAPASPAPPRPASAPFRRGSGAR